MGLSTAQIGSTIRTLVNGQVVTTYRGDEDEVDITVQLDGAGSIDDILDLTLLTPAGKQIPLRQIAAPEAATGPNQILSCRPPADCDHLDECGGSHGG